MATRKKSERHSHKKTVPISGLWVRTEGREGKQRINVLVEIDGEMRLVQSHFIGDAGGEISHHTTALGMARRHTKPDPLYPPRKREKFVDTGDSEDFDGGGF